MKILCLNCANMTQQNTNQRSQGVVESYTFFIFDHTVLKKEEDDLKDAIIYYFPPVDADSQCALVGQIIGMSEFFRNTLPKSFPTVFRLHKNKFVVRRKGDYTYSLGGSTSFSDLCLQKRLEFLLGTFVFYQGSLTALKQNLQSEFLSELNRLWNIYLPFCENVGDLVGQIFQLLPSVDIPKTNSQLFLQASHILQRSILRPNVLAGAILYRNQCLCTQLPPNITKRLLLLRPKQSHLSRAKVPINFDLPQGIQLLKVYLSFEEYQKLCPRRRTSLRTRSNRQNYIPDFNKLARESLDISGISFLECHSGINESSSELLGEKSTDLQILESRTEDTTNISYTEIRPKSESELEPDTSKHVSQSESNSESNVNNSNISNQREINQGEITGIDQREINDVHRGEVIDAHQGDTPLSIATTLETSSIKTDIPLDTTSSEDLSMGESCVDPREIKKHAKHLLNHHHSSVINRNKLKDIPTESCDTSNEIIKDGQVLIDKNIERDDGENSEVVTEKEIVYSDTSLLDVETAAADTNVTDTENNSDKLHTLSDTSHASKSIDTKSTINDLNKSGQSSEEQNKSSQRDIKDEKFYKESGLGQSSEFHLQTTIVDSNAKTVTLDVIVDEDENKLIKSSGSSITSDEMYSHNSDTLGFLSTHESFASLESGSSGNHKKSVTFSHTTSDRNSHRLSPSSKVSGTSDNESWQPLSDDLFDVVLYVQGHSDMMLLLFLEMDTKCERTFITNLWKSSVSHLADLDYEVKECLLKIKRDKQTKKNVENYHYLKYDSMMQTMSGNTLDPITSVGYDFVNTASKIHDSFNASNTTTEVLFRSHTGSCYGCCSVNNETFFQMNTPNKDPGGCPSPKDLAFQLDQTAADKLETKHNKTLL